MTAGPVAMTSDNVCSAESLAARSVNAGARSPALSVLLKSTFENLTRLTVTEQSL